MCQRFISVCISIGLFLVCSGSPVGWTEFAYSALKLESVAETEIYPRKISVQQAAAKKEEGAYILDVREAWEWARSHIPGSVLIPLAQLKNRLNGLPRDKEIIVVCRSGNRSMIGLDIIRKAGFDKSSSMVGGLIVWQASGYPTQRGQRSTP